MECLSLNKQTAACHLPSEWFMLCGVDVNTSMLPLFPAHSELPCSELVYFQGMILCLTIKGAGGVGVQ